MRQQTKRGGLGGGGDWGERETESSEGRRSLQRSLVAFAFPWVQHMCISTDAGVCPRDQGGPLTLFAMLSRSTGGATKVS